MPAESPAEPNPPPNPLPNLLVLRKIDLRGMRRARPSSRAGGSAPSPCVARSLTTPVGETGRSRRQASRGGQTIVVAAAVAGPNEDGPVLGSTAERGRYRQR